MNGSCNYILTRMEDAGLTYEEVFAEADGLGYLEADPNLDVGGIDAAHKLALLASIAFGTEVDFGSVVIEGIGAITIEDIHAAADMGYRVKLLGVAQRTGRGLEQRMTPCLVPANSPLGQLQGGTNMVILEGGDAGQIVLRGAGAGEGPTASVGSRARPAAQYLWAGRDRIGKIATGHDSNNGAILFAPAIAR
jgi:homoserine dehydrogenase